MSRIRQALQLGTVLVASTGLAAAALILPGQFTSSSSADQPLALASPGPIHGQAPASSPAPTKRKPAPTYACTTYSGVDRPNPVAALRRDRFAWSTFPPYQVGDGSGDINWRTDPYGNPSWYMWLHSLRWLGQGITAAGNGDQKALHRVARITRDWIQDNPYPWRDDVGAVESTMHRTNVLICLRQAVLSGLKVSRMPLAYTWIDEALVAHAAYLRSHYSGDWNHGTDESIALFGIGCVLDRAQDKRLAVQRLENAVKVAIDTQGATNEQSMGYALFNFTLWGRAIAALERCGVEPSPEFARRRAELATFLALGTDSLGRLHQLGDSESRRLAKLPGTAFEYAATLGKSGKKPGERVKVYDAGYVFGRTGWGETRPFTEESAYSIRFGPAKQLHGHSDHQAITYTSHGRSILIDGGHAGYKSDEWRTWAKSPLAHNVMTIGDSVKGNPETRLVRSAIAANAQFYQLEDKPLPGQTRTRSILVLKNPDLVITLDRGTAESEQQFTTHWHLAPGQQVTRLGAASAVSARRGDQVKTFLFQLPYPSTPPTDSVRVVTGQPDPVQGWHYERITTKRPAPVVQFTRTGRSAAILSVIAATKSRSMAQPTTRWVGAIMHLTIGSTVVTLAPDGTLTRLP